MTLEQVALAAMGMAMAALGWFARELYGAVNKLKDDLLRLEVRIGTDFVRYDRLRDMLEPIGHAVEEIRGSLVGKVDKP